jgi:hypothetical protein
MNSVLITEIKSCEEEKDETWKAEQSLFLSRSPSPIRWLGLSRDDDSPAWLHPNAEAKA